MRDVWGMRGHAFSTMSDGLCMMGIVGVSRAKTFFAPERHDHQTRHVHGCQQSSHSADKPQSLVEPRRHERTRAPGLPKDFVFREEASEDRNAADRQPPAAPRAPGDWHVL